MKHVKKPIAAWLHSYGFRPDDRVLGAAIQEIRDAVGEHGLTLGSRICEARELLSRIDPTRLRPPPTGWSFQGKLQAAMAGSEVAYTDAERAEMRSFWSWYLPLESGLLQLCFLLRDFAAAESQEDLHLDLRLLGQRLLQKYRDWESDGRIGWLPKRIGQRRERVTILDALARALVNDGTAAPPMWATEELPFEPPF